MAVMETTDRKGPVVFGSLQECACGLRQSCTGFLYV